MTPMSAPKATTVDGYLATLPADKRAALQWLRRRIRDAAPGAEECISYGIPGFRLDGKLLVHFGAAAKHCAWRDNATCSRHVKDGRADQSNECLWRRVPRFLLGRYHSVVIRF